MVKRISDQEKAEAIKKIMSTPSHVEPLTQTYAITFKDNHETIMMEAVDYEIKDGFLTLFKSIMLNGEDCGWDKFASYDADNIKQIVLQPDHMDGVDLSPGGTE